MELKIISENEKNNELIFLLKNATPAFANALRRIMLEEVPVMAIEDVEFRRNSSTLYDEMIALRLGLLPIKTDLKSYNLPRKCKCNGEGCARCQLKMTLKVKGPVIVYASDIKSGDSKIVPVYPKMPIVKLLKGQKLEFEATAMLGEGKGHAKWSPGHIYYTYMPQLNLKMLENIEDSIQLCSKHSADSKNNKLIEQHLLDCRQCASYLDAQDLTIQGDGTEFIFYIESWGQISCSEIFETALDIFQEKIENLQEELKKKEEK